MKEITYVTGNWAKIASAKLYLEPLGFKVSNIKLDINEIQADTVESVACASAKEASEILKKDVLKNDTGLYIEALNGFPGPYTHYADDTIKEDGILKLMQGCKNRNACFVEAFAYCKYGEEPIVFKSVTKGTIAEKKSGKYGWSWDYIFIPEGHSKTLANFPDEERFALWSDDGYRELIEHLKNAL